MNLEIETKPDANKQKGPQSPVVSTLFSVLKNCVNNASPRDTETIQGTAFDETHAELPDKLDYLKDWKDDGTESEILVDLLMETCLAKLKTDIMKDITGPASIKVLAWNTAKNAIHSTLTTILDPAWTLLQKAMADLQKKIDPVIQKGLDKIKGVLSKIESKNQEAFSSKLSPLIATHVTPIIKPFYDLLEAPIKECYRNGQSIIREQINLTALPKDKNQRNLALDKIPRNVKNQEKLFQPLRKELKVLTKKLLLLDAIIRKDLFEGLDVNEIQKKAEQSVLEIMDAFINTLETKLDNGGGQQASLIEDIMPDYEHDARICQKEYIKDVIHSELVVIFLKIAAPVADPILEQLNSLIPEEMQEFLDIKSLYEKFVAFTIKKLIDQCRQFS